MSNEAWRNARAMYEKDTCARTLGIEMIEMDDGYAQMSMTVSPAMLNGHQTCHGGSCFRWPTPRLPTPATARGWRRWLLPPVSTSCVRPLPATDWSPRQESSSRGN